MVREEGRAFFLAVAEIDWVAAAGKHVLVPVRGKEQLVRESITAVEQQLDPARFVRIHRSTVVNVDRIKEI